MNDELKGLDIKIDRYHIRSDKWSMWVETEVKTRKQHNTKNDTKAMVITGYQPTVTKLMKDFVDYSTRHIEAKKTADALKKMAKVRDDAIKVVTALAEEVDRKLKEKRK